MKTIKLLMIVVVAVFAFNIANAQIHLPPHPPGPPGAPPRPNLHIHLGSPPPPPGFGRRSGRRHRVVVRHRRVYRHRVVHHR